MSEESATRCVLIPCSGQERWAVPQNCLAEIVTINADSDTPPAEVCWRNVTVPVLDFGSDGEVPWCEERGGTGLIAIFLGLAGEDCEYWGVALRGNGLAVASLSAGEVVDAPTRKCGHASAAFEYQGALYQVPDLDGLQKRLASSPAPV
mgnify:CR=1 FL=1